MTRGRRICNTACKGGGTGVCRNRWKRLRQANEMAATYWF